MPTRSEDAARRADASSTAAPYGPVGLLLSTFAILALTAALLLLLMIIGFAALAAREGIHGAMAGIGSLAGTLDASQDVADRISIVAGILGYIALAGAIVVVARFRDRRRWTELIGWRAWDMGRGLPIVLLLLAATLFYSLIASSLIEQLYPQAKDWVQTPKGTPWVIGFLAMATLFAPVAEELMFRGWIYTSLRATIGARLGILVSAVLFALAHWESTHLYALAVFPVGLALGYIRQRAGSIAASITLHSLYNGIAAVMLFAAGS